MKFFPNAQSTKTSRTSLSALCSSPYKRYPRQITLIDLCTNQKPFTVRHIRAAVAEQTSASTYDADLQRLLLAGPPADFDFRAEVTTGSREWVDEHAPQLRDLVDDGTLVVVPRRPKYRERRTDGYCEPLVVLLVGTAHVSRKSQRDVDRVIRAVRPDSVVVELCKSRSAALEATTSKPPDGKSMPGFGPGTDPRVTEGSDAAPSNAFTNPISASGSDPKSKSATNNARATSSGSTSSATASIASSGGDGGSSRSRGGSTARPGYINPMSLADGGGGGAAPPGSGFLAAVSRSVSLGGQDALLLRVLLAQLYRRVARSLGVAGGGEFAAAQAAAEDVGAQVVLGDRPAEITLSRAWAALSLMQRLRLCMELVFGTPGAPRQVLNEELVNRLMTDDAISAVFNQMSSSYPELVGPLVTERDLYLAWSLKRSKAVNGARLVVGVVGRGHLRGLVHALVKDEGGAGLRFSDLVEGRNSRKRRREQAAQGLQRFVIEVALGTAAYLTWLVFNHEL